MKKILLTIGVLITTPIVLLVAFLSPLLARGITPPCFIPTGYHVARMHWIETRGEMGWSGKVEDAVKHLHQCRSDTEGIVRQLLADSSGTIASLGMDIIVREALVNGDTLLKQHHYDTRWNHNLAYKNEYSRLMLAMWKLKKALPLTAEDNEVMRDWPIGYFESFGVVPPEGTYWIPSRDA